MSTSQRWLLAGAGAAGVMCVMVVALVLGGLSTVFGAIGALATLVGLIGGWFAWAARPPGADEIAQVDRVVSEEALRRSVKTLPDLVSVPGLVDIGVEPRLRFVHDPYRKVGTAAVADIESAFGASHQRLLIVGAAGSGKTVAAYRLVARITDDPDTGRVPLVVNLSAWSNESSFQQFLVDYLCASGSGYGIASRRLAQKWLAERRFALVLDGLDEVPAPWRGELLTRLEDWLPVDMPLVLTCRTSEYGDLLQGRRRGIGLTMAVELQPLDDQQLDEACREIAKRGQPSWNDLTRGSKCGHRAVREALRSPLLLNLAVSSHLTVSQLRTAGKRGAEAVRVLIIDRYLANSLRDDRVLVSWVTWMAAYLTGQQSGPFGIGSADSTVFELSKITPDRFPLSYAIVIMPGLWVSFILVFGLVLGITPGSSPFSFHPILATMALLPILLAKLRNASPSHFQVREVEWRSLMKAMLRAISLGLIAMVGVTSALSLILSIGWTEGLPFGIFVALPPAALYTGWQVLRPSRLRIGSAFEGPWQQSKRSAWFLGLSIWMVFNFLTTFALVVASATSGWFISLLPAAADGVVTSVEQFVALFAFGSMIGFVVAVYGALNSGGWFLILQWLSVTRMVREYKLSPKPLQVFQRAMRPVGSGLPLLRPVGSGVRFLHNDVRDRLLVKDSSW